METAKQEVTVADTQQVELDPSKNAGALVLKEEDLDMLSDDPDDLQADLLALAGPAAGPNGGQIFIDGFSATASFLPRSRFARSASTRIRFQRSTTPPGAAASRF